MSSTSDFIAELVTAANEGDRLGLYEKVRLLDRAVTTIRELREQVGIPSSGSSADGIVDLLTSKPATAGRARTGERIKHAFLDAANTIRTLHIVLGHRLPIVGIELH